MNERTNDGTLIIRLRMQQMCANFFLKFEKNSDEFERKHFTEIHLHMRFMRSMTIRSVATIITRLEIRTKFVQKIHLFLRYCHPDRNGSASL